MGRRRNFKRFLHKSPNLDCVLNNKESSIISSCTMSDESINFANPSPSIKSVTIDIFDLLFNNYFALK